MKEKIRPIYSELQGYLSSAPNSSSDYFWDDAAFWNRYNSAVDELSKITEEDFSRFKVIAETIPWNRETRRRINIKTYRSNLSGLISRLHGQYFSDEIHPFSGTPSTIISQSQTQTQHIQILLEIQSRLDEKLPGYKVGSKERTFIEKLKTSLASVKEVGSLVTLILKTAKEFGLSIEEVLKIFL